MFTMDLDTSSLIGPQGCLSVPAEDEVTCKLAMLIEGECMGLGPSRAAQKYGYSRQRYFQLRHVFLHQGAVALQNRKRGPRRNYRRTEEVVRQIIRFRFLDPEMSAAVIGQKLRQLGCPISTSSVERVIAAYGLQKKTLSADERAGAHRDPPDQTQAAGRARGSG
jgi:hypothetical protein